MIVKLKITKTDMLSFLKVSNLILIATSMALCITSIIFKEIGSSHITTVSILLWASLMLLIMSLAYTFYFQFQCSNENWLNFGGEEDEDMVDEGAYAEDEIEEDIVVPAKDIPLNITNESEKDFDSLDPKQFHNQTIEDIIKLIDVCQHNVEERIVSTEKFDEIRHYTYKLKRYING